MMSLIFLLSIQSLISCVWRRKCEEYFFSESKAATAQDKTQASSVLETTPTANLMSAPSARTEIVFLAEKQLNSMCSKIAFWPKALQPSQLRKQAVSHTCISLESGDKINK